MMQYFNFPADILILVSGAIGLYAFQTHGRRRMLTAKLIADVIFASYLLILGGYTGAAAAFIACIGGCIQIATPPSRLKQSLKIRIAMACCLSAVAVHFLAESLTDLYPLFALIFSRFIELSHSTLVLRGGFLIAAVPWVVYNYNNGFYVAMGFSLLMICSMLLGILRNEKRLPKDPVP